MATKTRVYKVTPVAGGKARLVRASHPSHALRHVADEQFHVAVPDQDDLIELIQAGTPVESIAAEQAELPTD